MRLKIEHITTFTYDQPISEAYTEMCLRPQDGFGQHCLSFSLTTEPHDDRLNYTDRFGNDISHFDVIQPHDKLVVSARSEVITPISFAQLVNELSPLDEYDFLMPTIYAPITDDIVSFASTQVVPGNPKATAIALMNYIYASLQYEKGVTDVTTTAAQALVLQRGVCQDFSHLMLASCRGLKIPARYVSGYLYNEGLEAASHAWVDVCIPGEGWISLDPTHNSLQTAEYVRVAVGRDYADVPPTRGIFVGNARETMEVKVSVKVL